MPAFRLQMPRSNLRDPLNFLLVIALTAGLSSCKGERQSGIQPNDYGPVQTMVIITFDGVRPEEIFLVDPPHLQAETGSRTEVAMPFFLHELGPSGIFLGHPGAGQPMTVANPIGISLPGFQSIFSGRPTLCFNNECGQPVGKTLFSHILQDFGSASNPISAFASWEGLCPGLGLDDRFDAHCGAQVLQSQWRTRIGSPSKNFSGETMQQLPASPDEIAFQLALDRLSDPLPRLLYLALDATDATGHANDYPGHLAALARSDEWLRLIDERLQQLEAQGHRSALLVTTDHGRGAGEGWSQHRWNVPGSDRIWLFARGPGLDPTGPIETDQKTTLSSIRPTAEAWLGLEPACNPLGAPTLMEILAQPSLQRLKPGSSPGTVGLAPQSPSKMRE